jgi:hypothetical protein
MENDRPRGDQTPKSLLGRLDRAAGKMNAFLLVIAIGLAALDFTCFWVIKVRDALPAVTRVEANAATSAKPAASARHNVAAASPSGAGGSMTGF